MTHQAARSRSIRGLSRAMLVAAILIGAVFSPRPGLAQAQRSIREWVNCDPSTDQRDGAAKAFAAAAHNAFTLVVDCPVFIHVGQDVARPIFLDNGVSVSMTGAGKFIVDNIFIPTFVIADSSDIRMTGWSVEYIGSMPTTLAAAGYLRAGVFIAAPGHSPTGAAFNDGVLTPWLAAHRGVVFDRSSGVATSPWAGPTSTSAVFFIVGASSNLTITNMSLSAPPGADVAHLIPVCFQTSIGFSPGEHVTAKSQNDASQVAIPSRISVEGLKIDGAYMGWAGVLEDASFRNIESLRYGDLQTARNADLGGVGKWFAPPHLFYINHSSVSNTHSRHIVIMNVADHGQRLGIARDLTSVNAAGNALSLKFGADDSVVSNYTSLRPDGVIDVLAATNLVISGLKGVYNSAFANDIYPALRFPQDGLHNIVLKDISIQDTAPVTRVPPIADATYASTTNLMLKNVTVAVNRFAPGVSLAPTITGQGVSLDIRQVAPH